MRELKAKEDSKRQDTELDKAYYDRLSEQEREEVEESWDPIEEVVENERGTWIDLLQSFLLMPQTAHETAADIRRRLKEGMAVSYSGGMHIGGTIDTPAELINRTAPVPDEEIDRILEELQEIKLLLFCRLILSHAAILPATLRAASVSDFLADKEVTDNDLRDLCLKMDNPGMQDIRDACADLGREAEEDDPKDNDLQEEDESKEYKKNWMAERLGLSRKPRSAIPDKWSSEREKRSKRDPEVPENVKGKVLLLLIDLFPCDVL